MADSDTLQTIYSNYCAILLDMSAHPKPTYSLDGKSVSWSEYYGMILRYMDDVRRQMVFSAGPFELRSIGR
jgi:hypothetical protein